MSIDKVVQQAADAKSTQWNPDTLMELLERTEQGTRAMAAARYRVLSALAGHSLYQDPLQDTATEVACALRISEHTAQAQIAEAQILTRVLPETLNAPATGTVVQAEPTRYRPTPAVRRLVSARDRHCTFPTCPMPATNTDPDHITAFNHRQPRHGGLTIPENLHPLCRHHHQLKHQADRNVQRTETGTTTWTSPLGHHHTTATETSGVSVNA